MFIGMQRSLDSSLEYSKCYRTMSKFLSLVLCLSYHAHQCHVMEVSQESNLGDVGYGPTFITCSPKTHHLHTINLSLVNMNCALEKGITEVWENSFLMANKSLSADFVVALNPEAY